MSEFNQLNMITHQDELLQLEAAELQKELAGKNRELQIEAALKRIWLRTMAMKATAELSELIQTVYTELKVLDPSLNRCFIMIFDAQAKGATWWIGSGDEAQIPNGYFVQHSEHPPQVAYLKGWIEQCEKWEYELEGEGKKNWDAFLFSKTELANLPAVVMQNMRSVERVFWSASFSRFGCVATGSFQRPTEETFDILVRFAGVFDLTYTRFLDLQKAEAHTREAQIELGLERVRTKAMAMHNSDELKEVVKTLFEELTRVDVSLHRCMIWTPDPTTLNARVWILNPETMQGESVALPYNEDPFYQELLRGWKERNRNWIYTLEGEAYKKWVNYFCNHTEFSRMPEIVKASILGLRKAIFWAANYDYGAIQVASKEPYSDDNLTILRRFSKVFDMSYTRFLDLQKAEKQAREAQIEAVLEKVRSRSLAMHQSDELQEVVNSVFERLKELEIEADTVNIIVSSGNLEEVVCWTANNQQKYTEGIRIPFADVPVLKDLHKVFGSGQELFTKTYSVADKNKLYAYLFENSDFKYIPGSRKQQILESKHFALSLSVIKNAGIQFISYSKDAFTDDENEILKRFTSVFEQAYTRFLDLQKAEAQAREAEIELGLERVRAKTMAMKHYKDLLEVTDVVFEQLEHLGFDLDVVNFSANGLSYGDWDLWITSPTSESTKITVRVLIPWFDHPYFQQAKIGIYNFIERGVDLNVAVFTKQEKDAFLDHIFHNSVYKELVSEQERAFIYSKPGYTFSTIALKETWVAIGKYDTHPFTDEQHKILRRFAVAFEQAYTRFLDLKRAEAQAHEAQIEAALERIRAKALAMQTPSDLRGVVNVLREQMEALGQPELASSIVHIYNEDAQAIEAWYVCCPPNNSSVNINTDVAIVPYDSSEWSRDVIAKYKAADTEYTVVASGEKLKEWYYVLEKAAPATVDYDDNGQIIIPAIRYYHFSKFSGGALVMISNKEPSQETRDLQERTALVFDLAYTRFRDLRKAEAQTRESKRQASLDRVRAEIASMRSTADLERITPLIWNELTMLGVPFIRCGVFIMNEVAKEMETYLSTPEGEALAAFQLPYNSEGIMQNVLRHWRGKQLYTEHWNADAFTEWTKSLVAHGVLQAKEKYTMDTPPSDLYLHFFPFLQGMLYVGNTEPPRDDEMKLVQSLANAFSTAYARYDDFKKLESAKQQIEKTLVDLQAAQAQLVQAEKMASLGELTAGIAHEIQNPLNFVNNFSESNAELIDELVQELNCGNLAEASKIAHDIKGNEAKIIHHGKRADSIVKGMLQHSRKNSGQKELTDINALTDEYLRLSFHGFRAKDKTFNTHIKTRFDDAIGQVEVVPQDLGRVLLNLFNNAFYAVQEKKKRFNGTYEPLVQVSTCKNGSKIELRVKDNGMGIPENVRSKIFQPFFTTKPTGEGTGLGLSLSYDIITKGHSGELSVETEEGEGAGFVIILPGEGV